MFCVKQRIKRLLYMNLILGIDAYLCSKNNKKEKNNKQYRKNATKLYVQQFLFTLQIVTYCKCVYFYMKTVLASVQVILKKVI